MAVPNLSLFEAEIATLLSLEEGEFKSLSESEWQHVYQTAYDCYEKEEYRTAGKLFTRLVLSNPFMGPFWTGLASAKQMSRDYEAAIRAWALSALLDLDNPMPHLHAAECYLYLEQKEEAQKALNAALACSHDLAHREKIEHIKALI